MKTEYIDILSEKLDWNIDFISWWLDKKIIWALSSSNNYLDLILDNQSVSFNISWNTMFLYEIQAKWFWTNLMLQLIKKGIDNWLEFIKIEAKPLNLEVDTPEYKNIEKYIFSFYSSFGFQREWNSNYFTLNLDNDDNLNILNNKFNYYLKNNKWIKL